MPPDPTAAHYTALAAQAEIALLRAQLHALRSAAANAAGALCSAADIFERLDAAKTAGALREHAAKLMGLLVVQVSAEAARDGMEAAA